MAEVHYCRERVYRNYGFPMCGSKALHEHEGFWYCAIHHPVKAAERRAKRNAKWEAKEEQDRIADEAAAKEAAFHATCRDRLVQAHAIITAAQKTWALLEMGVTGDLGNGGKIAKKAAEAWLEANPLPEKEEA